MEAIGVSYISEFLHAIDRVFVTMEINIISLLDNTTPDELNIMMEALNIQQQLIIQQC